MSEPEHRDRPVVDMIAELAFWAVWIGVLFGLVLGVYFAEGWDRPTMAGLAIMMFIQVHQIGREGG